MVVQLTQGITLLKERLQEKVGCANRLLAVRRLLSGNVAQRLDGCSRVEDGDRNPRENARDDVCLTQAAGACFTAVSA